MATTVSELIARVLNVAKTKVRVELDSTPLPIGASTLSEQESQTALLTILRDNTIAINALTGALLAVAEDTRKFERDSRERFHELEIIAKDIRTHLEIITDECFKPGEV